MKLIESLAVPEPLYDDYRKVMVVPAGLTLQECAAATSCSWASAADRPPRDCGSTLYLARGTLGAHWGHAGGTGGCETSNKDDNY